MSMKTIVPLALSILFCSAALAEDQPEPVDTYEIVLAFTSDKTAAIASADTGAPPLNVDIELASVLARDPDKKLIACNWLKIASSDAAAHEKLKALGLAVMTSSLSFSDMLRAPAGVTDGLTYGSCGPFETPLSDEQINFIKAADWDGLRTSGVNVRMSARIEIWDKDRIVYSQRFPVVADPLRHERLAIETKDRDPGELDINFQPACENSGYQQLYLQEWEDHTVSIDPAIFKLRSCPNPV